MSEPTARPWKAAAPSTFTGQDGEVETPAHIKAISLNDAGERVTRFIADIYNGDTDEGAANATLIVKAVNSHDKLVEALGVALKARCDQSKCGQCEDLHDGYMGLGSEHGAQPTEAELDAARAALEEAKA